MTEGGDRERVGDKGSRRERVFSWNASSAKPYGRDYPTLATPVLGARY